MFVNLYHLTHLTSKIKSVFKVEWSNPQTLDLSPIPSFEQAWERG